MSLHPIVAALGGDLYAGGTRASIPAPGHSASDRSVSLLLSGDRLVVHCFGEASWSGVRAHLQDFGLIDGSGRILWTARTGAGTARPRPDRAQRIATARRLWEGAGALAPATTSRRYLQHRAVRQDPAGLAGLRHHGAAEISVYRSGGPTRPALIAAITAPDDTLTAVEVTYLSPSGRRDERLRCSRKMVGLAPAGSAVRLAFAASELVVGEGVMSVLSASDHLGLPAWALLSARNLAAWSPPGRIHRVIIAADRGAPGETAAQTLLRRLETAGVESALALPPHGAEDWNTFAMAERRKEGG